MNRKEPCLELKNQVDSSGLSPTTWDVLQSYETLHIKFSYCEDKITQVAPRKKEKRYLSTFDSSICTEC